MRDPYVQISDIKLCLLFPQLIIQQRITFCGILGQSEHQTRRNEHLVKGTDVGRGLHVWIRDMLPM